MELVLGITGGVGAGKSRILEILRQEYGARIRWRQSLRSLVSPVFWL